MPGPSRGQCSEHRVTDGIGETREGGVKAVPLVIHREVHVPVGEDSVFVGGGEIYLVLPELVVDIHQRGVGVEVVEIVARVLGIEHHLVTVGELALICSLHEEIAVPLLLSMFPHVVDNSPWNALAAVVKALSLSQVIAQIPLLVLLPSASIQIQVM